MSKNAPEFSGRQLGPLTRPVNSGSGNRPLVAPLFRTKPQPSTDFSKDNVNDVISRPTFHSHSRVVTFDNVIVVVETKYQTDTKTVHIDVKNPYEKITHFTSISASDRASIMHIYLLNVDLVVKSARSGQLVHWQVGVVEIRKSVKSTIV